jgi:electron transport complex protein RnfB
MFNLLSQTLDLGSILTVVAIVAVLAVVFAVLIVLVSKICYVKEDERVSAVSEKLAGANCGGCGYAGCADFAKALAEGKATINACGATSNENKEEIAKILDIPFSATAKTFAVVKCAGGVNCKDKYLYVGNSGCDAHKTFMGGRKACANGCLGEGSCVTACTAGGIKVKDGVALIDKNLCESCGACIRKCPQNLIELIPTTAKVYVACSTTCRGKDVMGACSVGCIGCGLCAKNCPEGAITMVNNLPVIDYEKCNGCLTCVGKCPRKSIKEI